MAVGERMRCIKNMVGRASGPIRKTFCQNFVVIFVVEDSRRSGGKVRSEFEFSLRNH